MLDIYLDTQRLRNVLTFFIVLGLLANCYYARQLQPGPKKVFFKVVHFLCLTAGIPLFLLLAIAMLIQGAHPNG